MTVKRIRCNSWTEEEMRLVDECLCHGLGPIGAKAFFPKRTADALSSKFRDRRKELGFRGRNGRPKTVAEFLPIRFIPAPRRTRPKPPPPRKYTPEELGCREMLRLHLTTGAHWIGDPEVYARVYAEVS